MAYLELSIISSNFSEVLSLEPQISVPEGKDPVLLHSRILFIMYRHDLSCDIHLCKFLLACCV